MIRRLAILICVILLSATAARSQFMMPPASRPTTRPEKPESADKLSVTTHELKLDDHLLRYRTTAGTLAMKDEAGKDRANFFFVAYELIRGDDADPRTRPITFIFNGGPGAAAVWLHMGAAGPMRVDVPDDGRPPAPPYRLVENRETWLDATDLVFIDPVGTGFSRAAQGEKPEEFFGVEKDIASVADFIRVYTTRYERWLSPKFVAGESYGTTRAAGLSEFLADRYGISLNGVILISCVLNFETISLGEGNNLPYPLYVPTYAAVAWYHKKLAPDLQKLELPKLLEEVEQWSQREYTIALAQGDALPADQRKQIIERLSRYSALKPDVIDKANLAVGPAVFSKELLSPDHKLVGRFDARIVGPDTEPIQPWPSYDPSLAPFLPAYAATFNDYVRRTLHFESELPYELLTDRVRPWDFGKQGGGYVYVGDNLRMAMVKNPSMRAMVASSYFDLATPFFATDYTVRQLELPAELRDHIKQSYYPAGHMMYHERASREKLKADVTAFIGKY